jgi:hypothetical protein
VRVVGAGLGRTGTLSLKVALEKLLGAPCYHMAEVFGHQEHIPLWHQAVQGPMPDWNDIFAGYQAAVDWPASAFWEELSRAYPDAVILLSVRDPESWWQSASNTIFPSSRQVEGTPWRSMMDDLFASRFTLDLDNRAACIEQFERHYEHVRRTAPADRLIEWRPGDDWGPLADALGVSIPDEPYPHVNTRDDWAKRQVG